MSVQTEVSLQKLPPQNIDAEQMVLGAILIENDSINNVVDHPVSRRFLQGCPPQDLSVMLEMFERRRRSTWSR